MARACLHARDWALASLLLGMGLCLALSSADASAADRPDESGASGADAHAEAGAVVEIEAETEGALDEEPSPDLEPGSDADADAEGDTGAMEDEVDFVLGVPEDLDTGPLVHHIDWQGVTAYDEDELEDRIVTTVQPRFRLRFWRPKHRFDEFVLEEDVDRIVEAYREIGYFETTVHTRVEDLSGDRVNIEFEVEEGTRVRLESWTLEIHAGEGPDAEPSAEERRQLEENVRHEPDQAFGSKIYLERRNALLRDCGDLGFPSARIRGGAEVDPVAGTARVAWSLDLGPRTAIGEIRILGLEGVDPEIVRRELLFDSGDRYSTSSLAESERRLVGTDLFRTVTIIALPSAADPFDPDAAESEQPAKPSAAAAPARYDVEIRVEEALPRSLRVSVGYGTEEGPRTEASIDWRNFTGQARRLRIRAFASFLDAGIDASLGQPYVFGRLARADFAVSALRQSRPGYEAFVTGASGSLTLYPERDGPWSLTLGPGYQFSRIISFEIDIDEPLRGPRQSVIVDWFTIGRYQRVDNVLNPTRGFRADLRNELGGFPIGSELDYQLWEIDLRGYYPMGPFVWAAKASATTLDPIGEGLAAVPLTKRLYAGGTNSVRGFGFQKLGPTDSGNDPTGGLSRMLLGVELRTPYWRKVGLVGFVDAGEVRVGSWSWRPKDLRASAGPGLRIETPVGPLRFDFGFLLNPPKGADPWRFHLSIGQAF